jgi:hypothetical protein
VLMIIYLFKLICGLYMYNVVNGIYGGIVMLIIVTYIKR